MHSSKGDVHTRLNSEAERLRDDLRRKAEEREREELKAATFAPTLNSKSLALANRRRAASPLSTSLDGEDGSGSVKSSPSIKLSTGKKFTSAGKTKHIVDSPTITPSSGASSKAPDEVIVNSAVKVSISNQVAESTGGRKGTCGSSPGPSRGSMVQRQNYMTTGSSIPSNNCAGTPTNIAVRWKPRSTTGGSISSADSSMNAIKNSLPTEILPTSSSQSLPSKSSASLQRPGIKGTPVPQTRHQKKLRGQRRAGSDASSMETEAAIEDPVNVDSAQDPVNVDSATTPSTAETTLVDLMETLSLPLPPFASIQSVPSSLLLPPPVSPTLSSKSGPRDGEPPPSKVLRGRRKSTPAEEADAKIAQETRLCQSQLTNFDKKILVEVGPVDETTECQKIEMNQGTEEHQAPVIGFTEHVKTTHEIDENLEIRPERQYLP